MSDEAYYALQVIEGKYSEFGGSQKEIARMFVMSMAQDAIRKGKKVRIYEIIDGEKCEIPLE